MLLARRILDECHKFNEAKNCSRFPNGDIKIKNKKYGDLIFRPRDPEIDPKNLDYVISYCDCLNWGSESNSPILYVAWDVDMDEYDDREEPATGIDTAEWPIAYLKLRK